MIIGSYEGSNQKPSLGLDDLIIKYETDRQFRYKSKGAKIIKSCLRTVMPIVVLGVFASSIMFYKIERSKLATTPKFDETPTAYYIKGNKGSTNNKNRNIYFTNPQRFQEIQRFFEVCQIAPNEITESNDQTRLAFSVSPGEVKQTAELYGSELGKAFSGHTLDRIVDGQRKDIYILRKDGSEFWNLTNMVGDQLEPSWYKDDTSIRFWDLKSAQDMKQKKIHISTKEVIDLVDNKEIVRQRRMSYLTGLGISFGLLGAYGILRRRKDKPLLRGASFAIVNHPVATTATYLAYTGVKHYLLLQEAVSLSLEREILRHGSYSVVGVGFTSYMLYSLLSVCRPLKQPYTTNFFRSMFGSVRASLSRNSETKIKALELMKSAQERPEILDWQIGAAHFKKQSGKGFKFLRDALTPMVEGRTSTTPGLLDHVISPPIHLAYQTQTFLNPSKIQPRLSLISAELASGNYRSVLSRWDALTDERLAKGEVKKHLLDLNCLYAVFLHSFEDSVGKRKDYDLAHSLYFLSSAFQQETKQRVPLSGRLQQKSAKQWDKTIEMVLTNPTLTYSYFTEIRNQVFVVNSDELIGDTILFKLSRRRDWLDFESNILQYYRRLDKRFVRPLTIRKYNGSHIFVMTRIPGKTLYEMVQEHPEREIEYLEKAIRAVGFLHANRPSHLLPTWGFQEYMSQVLVDRESKSVATAINESVGQETGIGECFAQNYAAVAKELDADQGIMWKDARQRNFVVEPDERYNPIDFESSAIAPPSLDLSILIESERMTDKKRETLLSLYWEDFNLQSKEKIQDKSKFLAKYDYGCLHRSLNNFRGLHRIIESGIYSESTISDQRFNLERSIEILDKLKSEARKNRPMFANLWQGLTRVYEQKYERTL